NCPQTEKQLLLLPLWLSFMSCHQLLSDHAGTFSSLAVADIVFLVDGSWSIGAENFEQIRQFLYTLVDSFDVRPDHVRISLVQYSNSPRTEFLLNTFQDKADILQYISKLPYMGGGTHTGQGLDFMLKEHFVPVAGSRAAQKVPQIAVVITDGKSQDNVESHAQDLKRRGIVLYAIGIKDADEDQLREIANEPYSQHVYSVGGLLQTVCISMEDQRQGNEHPQNYCTHFLSVIANLVGDASALFGSTNVTVCCCEESGRDAESDCKAAKLADIVFIVDESGSIGTSNFQLVRTFLYSIINGLEVSTTRVRVGIVTYNDRATAQVYLNSFSDKKELLNFIKILPYHGGGTRTGAALNRKDRGVQQVAVVITDGESQDNVSQPAAELRRAGVTVYSVGVKDAKEAQLVEMASYPSKKHVFIVDSFKILCQNILRQNSPYFCISFPGCVQTDEADIFFLIDHSGSIYPSDFHDMKKFIIEFLQTFRIGPQHVRMGVVKYADSPNLEFDLNTYTDTKALEKAVEGIKQVGGGTETGRALKYMSPLFTEAMASRGHKVPEYLVVITDGKSSDEVKAPAAALRAQGVIVYAIGVKNADQTELREIAGDSKKTFFDLESQLALELCDPHRGESELRPSKHSEPSQSEVSSPAGCRLLGHVTFL
uniref:VWFA domain-containing protein n=1 Tax=Echeneis naucrates TaxID=173247 RepID=A0A665U2E7_ECHNA